MKLTGNTITGIVMLAAPFMALFIFSLYSMGIYALFLYGGMAVLLLWIRIAVWLLWE